MKIYLYLFVSIMLAGTILPDLSFCQIKYQINLADKVNEKGEAKLNSIASNIEYIPLETNPDCLLGSDYKFELTEQYIFVFDYVNLYRFSISGKFLNRIGRQGKGPGEYIRLGADFAIDNSKKEVFLLDFRGRKILVHKYDGTFLRALKLQFSGQFMALLNEKFIIHNNNNYNRFSKNNPTYELEVINYEGKAVNLFESTLDPSEKYGLSLHFPHFYEFNNSAFYKNPFNDTIYCFRRANEMNPYALINVGKYERDKKQSDFRAGAYIRDESSLIVSTIEENKQYMFISLIKGEEFRLVYDKDTKQCTNGHTGLKNLIEGKRGANYTKGLINNLDGGFPFWPREIHNDSILIDYRYAYEFKFLDNNWFRDKEVLNKDKMEKLKKLAGRIDELDNPVIVIAR
ncbi:MAG: 6-bladed beta-propeller [Cytophagales bacterium]|nr:6-bladed beta-propeller [Cytophagales bacterium]